MSASLFSSYLALREHRNSPRDLRAMKFSPEKNLRDRQSASPASSSWWGQAPNPSEPQVLSCENEIINSDSAPQETHEEE